MGFLRGFGLVVFSIILILSLSVFIFAFSFNILLYPSIYENALESTNSYSLIQDKILGNNAQFIRYSEDLSEVINPLIRNVLSYARGDSEKLNLEIQLNNENMKSYFGKNLSLPSCRYGQDPYGEPPCMPQGMNSSQYLDSLIEKRNMTFVNEKNISLENIVDPEGNLLSLRESVSLYRNALWTSIVLSLLMVIFILLLKRNEINSGLRWVGTSFIITSIFGLIIKLGQVFAVNNIRLPSELLIFQESFLFVMNEVFFRVLIYTIIVFALGVLCWIVSFFIGKKKA